MGVHRHIERADADAEQDAGREQQGKLGASSGKGSTAQNRSAAAPEVAGCRSAR
jgi:hypothetical protein